MLQDIARDVGKQVEMMILKAKHASETKVSSEIVKIKVKMESINQKIQLVRGKLNRLEGASEPISRAELLSSIDKLEEVWEGEVGMLKHELWQTIQAHNHNADLMKHHKEAIDQVQSRVAETSNPEMAQIQEQLAQVERTYRREQEKQQQIDTFMTRISTIQHQLNTSFPSWGLPGLPPPQPPVPMGPGMLPQAASKKAAAKKPKAKAATAKAPSAAHLAAAQAQAAAVSALLPSMRAEAPEFVPTVAPFDGSL